MSCLDGDFEVGKAMCDFLNKCFAKRSENLKYSKDKNVYLRPEFTVTKSGRLSKRPSRLDV